MVVGSVVSEVEAVNKRRFRWTRARYKHAHHLNRLLARMYELPYGDPPAIVQRLWELREAHPQDEDQLLRPFRHRASVMARGDDGIPF